MCVCVFVFVCVCVCVCVYVCVCVCALSQDLARMVDTKLPKQLLFGELTKVCPGHGTKRKWRDLAVADVRAVNLEGKWCEIAQDKGRWRKVCEESANSEHKKQSHPS